MEKRYCEVRGKRYESAEAYQTGWVCDGCAAEFDDQLCVRLGECGIGECGIGYTFIFIWVECNAEKTEGEE